MEMGLTGSVGEDALFDREMESQSAKLILKDGFIGNENGFLIESDGAMQVADLVTGEGVLLACLETKDEHFFGYPFNDDFNVGIPIQDVPGRQNSAGRKREPKFSAGFRLEALAALLTGFPVKTNDVSLGRRGFGVLRDYSLDEQHCTCGLRLFYGQAMYRESDFLVGDPLVVIDPYFGWIA